MQNVETTGSLPSYTYTYNSDGTLATKTDAKNQMVKYIYDGYQRIQTITRYPISTGQPDPCQTATFTWGLQSDNLTPCTNGSFAEVFVYYQNGSVWDKRLQYSLSEAPGVVATGGLDGWFSYDSRGNVTGIIYPNDWPTSGGLYYTYTYTQDTMARMSSLIQQQALGSPPGSNGYSTVATWANNVSYGPANEMTQIGYGGYTESRTYTSLLQLTRQTATGSGLPTVDLEYVFATSNNNGQITQVNDHVSGEQVHYTYDTLGRLSTAATVQTGGTQWGLGFSYDGFGNRLAQTQTAGQPPSATFNYDTHNHITTAGFTYDLNGNMTTIPGVGSVTYDVENHLNGAGSAYAYIYTQSGQRIYRAGTAVNNIDYFGVDGRKLASYQPSMNYNVSTGQYYISFNTLSKDLYFNGRLIVSNSAVVVTDRLGSVRANATTHETFHYYPYGEEYATTTQDREKFGTYVRDSSGLDYANQRFYRSINGGFLSPDPYQAGANGANNPADPGSWNRVAYTRGDPVNRKDQSGQFDCPTDLFIDGIEENCDDPCFGGNEFEPGFASRVGCFVLLPPIRPRLPQCTVTLEGQPVPHTGGQFFHTFLAVNMGIGSPTEYLEGVPIPKDRNRTSPFSDPMWLNGSSRVGSSYYSIGVDFTSAITATEGQCITLIDFTSIYIDSRNGTITYNNTNPFAGPNSNSFTHSLLVDAGISTPWWWASLNVVAPGWGNTSVPFP